MISSIKCIGCDLSHSTLEGVQLISILLLILTDFYDYLVIFSCGWQATMNLARHTIVTTIKSSTYCNFMSSKIQWFGRLMIDMLEIEHKAVLININIWLRSIENITDRDSYHLIEHNLANRTYQVRPPTLKSQPSCMCAVLTCVWCTVKMMAPYLGRTVTLQVATTTIMLAWIRAIDSYLEFLAYGMFRDDAWRWTIYTPSNIIDRAWKNLRNKMRNTYH